MSNTKAKEGFSSRIGYIASTIGMALGVGAMWRFPMKTALNGGGAYVLAFIIVTLIIVIPAGFGESALGRHYKKSAIGTFNEVLGKKGKILGYIMAIIPIILLCYYPIVMGNIIEYIGYLFAGAPFMTDTNFYNSVVNPNRLLTFIIVAAIIILNSAISLKGVQSGVEKACKIMLPIMFICLIIIVVRVFTLPGIAEGIEYYVKPDFSQMTSPTLWMEAAGMALFAVGLGPGYLMTYGMYMDDDADLATDFITVNVVQLFACVLCGFAIIPVVKLFGQEVIADKGFVFSVLPYVFGKMSGGVILFGVFMVALFFAGLSSTLGQLEIPVTCLMDEFGWSRTKAILVITAIAIAGSIPCIWNDAFFTLMDNLAGNVGYCLTAAGVAIIVAWVIGAKKVREEWYNPTSVIQYGSWMDFLYKYVACGTLIFFTVTAVMSLF